MRGGNLFVNIRILRFTMVAKVNVQSTPTGMKKRTRNQGDVPVVLDCTGVNVLDPNGVHPVTMKLSVEAEDSESETPFEGEIELIMPHNPPKNFNLPKIEVQHPKIEWSVSFHIPIDDAFLNQIIERRLLYKFIFHQKLPNTKGSKQQVRRSADRSQKEQLTANTFLLDASSLVIRGGEFKPILEVSATGQPKWFKYFTASVSIDFPLLSDAQIRKFKPVVLFLKTVHQIPELPSDYSDFLGPYIVVETSSDQRMTTVPRPLATDMKFNLAVILWNGGVRKVKLEFHDRESNPPEFDNPLGSGYIEATFKPSTSTAKFVVQNELSLSIENILGIPADTIHRPYGAATLNVRQGKIVEPIRPVDVRDSVIVTPRYIAAGTYVTALVEEMVRHIPDLPAPSATATSGPAKQTASNKKPNPSPKRAGIVPDSAKKATFRRIVLVSDNREEHSQLLSQIQDTIVHLNARVFGMRDCSTVGSMKVDDQNSAAISGFIILAPPQELVVLEFLCDSDIETELYPCMKNLSRLRVLCDETDIFKERVYGKFDCAVKKFKFPQPISEILKDPVIYFQGSHLADCFTVLNQLNQLLQVKTYQEIQRYSLWPNPQDLIMANAKKGALLTMEEQAFPPLTKEVMRVRSLRFVPKPEPKEEPPKFVYTPVQEETVEEPPHDYKYFAKRNYEYIKKLNARNKSQSRNVYITEDGETQICRVKAGEVPKFDDTDSWTVEKPERFSSFAHEASDRVFFGRLREEDGSEIRGGRRFICKSPISHMSNPIDLKVDKNGESWDSGDKSLANTNTRWLKESRGRAQSSFRTRFPKQELFGPAYHAGQEEYRPQTAVDFREYPETKGVKHRKRFRCITPTAGKHECLRVGDTPVRPLSVQEKYRDRPKTDMEARECRRKPRFTSRYNPPVPKGGTDSLAVRKMKGDLPNL